MTRVPFPKQTADDRAWLARWAESLVHPVADLVPEGSGRVCLAVWGADYEAEAAEMEAFVRPLWGLAPLISGGFAQSCSGIFCAGIAAGTDPQNPEFWGDVGPSDQRMVEMAGIAFAWLLAPGAFWEPLDPEEQDRAAAWMLSINDQPTSDNNWLFFRVLVNLALARLGRDWSRASVDAALDRLDAFHLGNGWYRDGEKNQIDHYVPMAFHFYGLIFARFGSDLFPERAAVFRARARAFAQSFQYWFSRDGAAIPFGRSMTYRMAQSAFWAACAFAGEDVLPWPRIKGLLLRNLRWWSARPITNREGTLSIGYAYGNPLVGEGYNGAGAPYWALKPFLVLALGQDHPFWQAAEEAAEDLPEGEVAIPEAGFLVRRQGGQASLLTGGQDARQFRGCESKYAGFAYSSAFAFSVPSDASQPDRPEMSAVDSGLTVSRDGLIWLRRGRITDSGLRDGLAWGRWSPFSGLEIESWSAFAGPGWHVRLHRITTDMDLHIAESGFAVNRAQELDEQGSYAHAVFLSGQEHVTGILDLGDNRRACTLVAAPNTHLLFPRTRIPRLVGIAKAGTSIVTTAVLGCAVGTVTPVRPLLPMAFLELEQRLKSRFTQ